MVPRMNTFEKRGIRALGLLALWVLASMPAVRAQSATVVRPDPDSLGLEPGAEGSIALRVDNVHDLYGLEIHLSFDPAIVQVVDADAGEPGVQILVGDWLQGGFVAANQVDNTSGSIDFAATLLNPAPPISGSRSFATITFKARQEGVTALNVDQVILATRDADVIESEVQSGLVGVTASGEAPAPIAETSPVGDSAQSPLTGVPVVAILSCLAVLSIGAFLAALVVLMLVARARRKPRG